MLRLIKWLFLVAAAAAAVAWLWLELQDGGVKEASAPGKTADAGNGDSPAGKAQDAHSAGDREALEKLIRDRLGGEKKK
ncbi:MAG: hypothetical protein D6806_04960 [Deltaproteobacteria bacterium]|nr:MAG: hypothetical protein D6806_04960 [Deltaproteobacteria bacterium]